MRQTTYETNNLYLKILKPVYANEVLDYYKRNKLFFREWDPKREDEFYTAWYHREALRYEYDCFKNKSLVKLWIIKKENRKIIGNICFSNIIMGNFKSCYLAYKLDKDEINKGYTTEAIAKGVEVMFDDYGLHRIEVNIVPRNARSLRVVEKLGFEYEGASKQYLQINGKWEDHLHFAVYNEDIDC